MRVAVHEAGHAVALLSVGVIPAKISITATEHYLGRVSSPWLARSAPADLRQRCRWARRRCFVALAGAVAEQIVLGRWDEGSKSDFIAAENYIAIASPCTAMESCAIGRIWRRTRTALMAHGDLLVELAIALCEAGALSADQLRDLILSRDTDRLSG